jgi:hypothetical protein
MMTQSLNYALSRYYAAFSQTWHLIAGAGINRRWLQRR